MLKVKCRWKALLPLQPLSWDQETMRKRTRFWFLFPTQTITGPFSTKYMDKVKKGRKNLNKVSSRRVSTHSIHPPSPHQSSRVQCKTVQRKKYNIFAQGPVWRPASYTKKWRSDDEGGRRIDLGENEPTQHDLPHRPLGHSKADGDTHKKGKDLWRKDGEIGKGNQSRLQERINAIGLWFFVLKEKYL